MKSVEPESHNEIIVVRRGGRDEDEHHGGAWEIAYADFMTSMMAFFLVMWLVNAANEETKAAVASYFNPIKLVDRSTNSRGIEDNNASGDEDKIKDEDSKGRPSGDNEDEKRTGVNQQTIMNEPYETLDKIAKKSAPAQSAHLDGSGGNSAGGSQKGASGGTAYRDPFSPDYWSENASKEISVAVGGMSQNSGGRDPNLPTQPGTASAVAQQEQKVAANESNAVQAGEGLLQPQHLQSDIKTKFDNVQNVVTTPGTQKTEINGEGTEDGGQTGSGTQSDNGNESANAQNEAATPGTQRTEINGEGTENGGQTGNATQSGNGNESANAQNETATGEQKTGANGEGSENKDQTEKTDQPAQPSEHVTQSETPQQAAQDTSLPKVVREISGELSKLIKDNDRIDQPMVRVVSVKDGIAIELMDQANYGMFAIGSAQPDKKVVDLMAGIAKILQNKKGDVIVSGHTDSRPYRTATYDNWQLSSSRAQMAYYMLVRGGLDEKRILRVEGYADHQLKNKADPYAAENRRIEVFMRLPQNQDDKASAPSGESRKKQ